MRAVGQQDLSVGGQSDLLDVGFGSQATAFLCESKINVELITTIQNVPACNSADLKGCRSDRRRAARVVGFDERLKANVLIFLSVYFPLQRSN